MKSTFKVLFYLKKDKISKDGKVPVMGRITVNGTQAEMCIRDRIGETACAPVEAIKTGTYRPEPQRAV